MRWLILSENEDKAAAFSKAMRGADFISVSTEGLAWIVEVIIEGKGISLKKRQKATPATRAIIRKIEDAAADCDRVLLAFDPDTLGEACAWEYAILLGHHRCARWPAPSLEPNAIRNEIRQLEAIDEVKMPKPDEGRANCYWAQRAIDITWTEKTSEWLTRKNANQQQKITRLMAALLKVVGEETEDRKIPPPQKYWEVRCSLKTHPAGEKRGISAFAIVPPISLFDESVPNTKKTWTGKIREAKAAAQAGRGIWQPNTGEPWRFRKDDARWHSTNLTKFPYFVIEKVDSESYGKFRDGPLTYSEIHKMAAMSAKKSTPESIDRHLMDLYHLGWITHPKSTNPNLKASTVAELVEYAKTQNLAVDPDPQRFGVAEDRRWVEAIRPTRWDRRPEKATAFLADEEGKTQKIWLYRMIYQFALGSQLAFSEEKTSKIYLLGPIPEPRNGLRSGSFYVEKENRLTAHMNLILRLDWEGETPEHDTVFECTTCEYLEKSVGELPPLTEEILIQTMVREKLGKRKSLKDKLNFLKENDYLRENAAGEVVLSNKGVSLHNLFNNHFGQYLDRNYHRSVSEALGEVEAGISSCQTFLDEWWSSFKPSLE